MWLRYSAAVDATIPRVIAARRVVDKRVEELEEVLAEQKVAPHLIHNLSRPYHFWNWGAQGVLFTA